jgi:tetratricopeptide (TPR) repeat protein
MTHASRNRSLLPVVGALALFTLASAVRAQESGARDDAARAMDRAERLIQQREFKAASTEFERASELTGGPCPACLLGVGRAYSGAQQYEAAAQVTRMAATLFTAAPDQAKAYDQLGTILALKGDMDAARAAFGKAVQLDGRMGAQVRSSLAEALLERVSYAQAAEAKRAASTLVQEVAVVASPQK